MLAVAQGVVVVDVAEVVAEVMAVGVALLGPAVGCIVLVVALAVPGLMPVAVPIYNLPRLPEFVWQLMMGVAEGAFG